MLTARRIYHQEIFTVGKLKGILIHNTLSHTVKITFTLNKTKKATLLIPTGNHKICLCDPFIQENLRGGRLTLTFLLGKNEHCADPCRAKCFDHFLIKDPTEGNTMSPSAETVHKPFLTETVAKTRETNKYIFPLCTNSAICTSFE